MSVTSGLPLCVLYLRVVLECVGLVTTPAFSRVASLSAPPTEHRTGTLGLFRCLWAEWVSMPSAVREGECWDREGRRLSASEPALPIGTPARPPPGSTQAERTASFLTAEGPSPPQTLVPSSLKQSVGFPGGVSTGAGGCGAAGTVRAPSSAQQEPR